MLRDLNLALTKGQNIALVGASGCGKSTCIQLLQRFYNLRAGDLVSELKNPCFVTVTFTLCLQKVDENSIESLSVPWLRSKMSIVSQEPVLFDRTLAENIQYGDNNRNVSMDEVVDAARRANIHSFITSLPQVSVQLCLLYFD